jgi:cytochrome P450
MFNLYDRTGWDFDFGIMPYGPRWRGLRRIFHQYFNQTASPNYRNTQTSTIHGFLRRCLDQTGKELDPLNIRL